MTVLLLGVGADTDHLRPALELDDSGKFEYIPIPETETGSDAVTYGDWSLNHREGTAIDLVQAIRPYGKDGTWIEDEEKISTWPTHHDPNFEALTFGDRRGGGGKGSTLIKYLDPGDVLGFYTGMKRGPDDEDLHRFLYDYMTVGEVRDLSSITGEAYYEQLQEFPENAHTKRLEGSGSPKHDDVVIVDGTEPSNKLTYPIRMTERLDSAPWYKITDDFGDEFNIVSGLKGVCRKFPVRMDLEREEFLRKVESTARQSSE